MANANSPVTMPTGVPLATPVYLVINDGSVVSITNGIPVNIVAGSASGYTDGQAAPTHPIGTALEFVNGSSNWQTVNSTNGLPISVLNANANGQNTMANSAPVVIASDQSTLPVKRSAVAVYSLASTATTSSGNSGDLAVGPYTEISLDINITAKTGTNPTIQFTYSRKGADGIYYPLWQTATLTNTSTQVYSTSIGAGMAYNQSLGSTGQLSWVIGGSATPGYTFSANLTGK